ncbi:MAG: hypothetical protein HFF19_01390 [Oscillospiraceae bacterium]|jgi:hypothetical protein|nr:hypothetical protein [Oscillospiraceae bacterium]
MKKRVLTLLMASLCALTLVSSALAPVMASPYTGEETNIETRAEQVRWYYRIHDGEKQMRLWSISYGVWKTDWIPVPPDWSFPDN